MKLSILYAVYTNENKSNGVLIFYKTVIAKFTSIDVYVFAK